MKTLQTFQLPSSVDGSDADQALGRALIAAWQADGIFQVQATLEQQAAIERALSTSRAFFRQPLSQRTGGAVRRRRHGPGRRREVAA